MGPRAIDQEQLAAAMNEWMRRYIEEPERFQREFQTVQAFKEADDTGKVPSYGADSAAYVLSIHDELAAKAEG